MPAPMIVHEPPVDSADASRADRIEVTGSSIKRIADEGAMPVQTISREDIAKSGATTAAEILKNVSAATKSLGDGGSINIGGYDQKGFNSANLRGLGTSSTLVLLNGRRMANFASPGDDAGVDLNNIPAAAIARVEILLDGASAIYGTDAIGGVINFVTRHDYQGIDLDAYLSGTQEGGAGRRTASLSAGFGDLRADGFNVMTVLDLQRTQRLGTEQRAFIGRLSVCAAARSCAAHAASPPYLPRPSVRHVNTTRPSSGSIATIFTRRPPASFITA